MQLKAGLLLLKFGRRINANQQSVMGNFSVPTGNIKQILLHSFSNNLGYCFPKFIPKNFPRISFDTRFCPFPPFFLYCVRMVRLFCEQMCLGNDILHKSLYCVLNVLKHILIIIFLRWIKMEYFSIDFRHRNFLSQFLKPSGWDTCVLHWDIRNWHLTPVSDLSLLLVHIWQ